MSGVQYLTDEKGKKTAVVVDLTIHAGLWEDIQDLLVSRSRAGEKSASLANVKAKLINRGKLRG